MFYDFKTGYVYAPIASKVTIGGFQLTELVPGRMIDNCDTATQASERYGKIVGINCHSLV